MFERTPKTMTKLMPTLEDPNSEDNNQFRCESTPILIYLDTKYPQPSLSLFPSSPEQHQRVIDTCVRLDSELGLYARRLAYVQFLNEKRSVVFFLLGEKFSWAYNPNDIRSRLHYDYARSRLHRIREEHLREKNGMYSFGNW
jgi:glutathione S-transferase